MAVRQVASIHFKNFVAKNWSPHEAGEPPMIPENAKIMIRDNILTFVAQVPPLLRYINYRFGCDFFTSDTFRDFFYWKIYLPWGNFCLPMHGSEFLFFIFAKLYFSLVHVQLFLLYATF
ncbi:hypothetical protein BHM03_00062864 [Ensete ventricosum]|nr:hypothetical protein BHM03_00062864 [Ensete ventricosum]